MITKQEALDSLSDAISLILEDREELIDHLRAELTDPGTGHLGARLFRIAERAQDRHRLVDLLEPHAVGWHVRADRLLLGWIRRPSATAGADAEQEPTPRHLLEGRRHRGQQTGAAVGDVQHERAEDDALGDLLDDLGVDLEAALDELKQNALSHVDELLEDGVISEERADQMREMIETIRIHRQQGS